MYSSKNNGFTLVELAIVLMIIGLLIGGILRGQELMNNARVSSTVQQVKAYEGAVTTFRDIYSALPGDLATATFRLPGCNAASSCVSGNGNSIVGTPNTRPWGDGNNTNIATENFQFWKHLALVHLISGVNPSASVASFGRSNPTMPISGGFSIIHSMPQADQSAFNGLVLRTHKDFILERLEDNPSLSPQHSAQIDRKMDDGIPFAGDVRASQLTSSSNPGATECEQSYMESVREPKCVLFFMMAR